MRRYLIILCMAVLAAAACTAEEQVPGQNADEIAGQDAGNATDAGSTAGSAVVRLSAEISDPASKTSLTDEEGSRYILWSEGDRIGIVAGSGIAVGEIDNSSIEGRSAVFTYPEGEGEASFAFYPYSASATVDANVLTTELPTVQAYSASSVFAPGVCLMAGKYAEGKLSFTNVCSIVEFQLTGSETITRASLRSASGFLSGPGSIDFSASAPEFTPGEGAKHYVTLDFGSGLALSGTPTPIYFVIPAGSYSDLELVTEGAGGSARIVSTASHSFAQNHIVPMSATPVARDLGGENLSEAGTANCYLIAPEKTGRFTYDAKKVRGSSVSGAVADVLWQSEEGLVGNVVYDAEAGKIAFDKALPNAGNALICLFDASHKVVWSWHIWMSAVNEHIIGRVAASWANFVGYTSVTHYYLDRNLGATWSPANTAEVEAMSTAQASDACGFLYQYGRPVPFPSKNEEAWSSSASYEDSADAFASLTRKVAVSPYYEGYDGWEITNLDASKADMAAYPMSFNKIRSSANATYAGSWANDVHCTTGTPEWTEEKTDADPCPAGYRVPTKTEMYNYIYPGANSSYTITQPEQGTTSSDSWQRVARFWNYKYGSAAYFPRSTNITGSKRAFVYIPVAGTRPSGGGSNLNNNNYTGVLRRNISMFWCFNPEDYHNSATDCSYAVYRQKAVNVPACTALTYGSETAVSAKTFSKIDPDASKYIYQTTQKEIASEADIYQQFLQISPSSIYMEEPSASIDGATRLLLAQSADAFSVRCVKITEE